jgi:hypothetical protein
MKFVLGLCLFAVAMFGSIFFVQAQHFNEEKIACIKAGGSGTVLHSDVGIPVRYECMKMHLVLKFRNGGYK